MPQREINGIETIQQGRIDFYIPLKFETSINFEGVCKEINDTLNETINDHLSKIQFELQDAFAAVQDEMCIKHGGKLSISRNIKKWMRDKRELKRASVSRSNDGTFIEISPSERGVEVAIKPGEMSAYNDRCEELNFEYEQYEKIYGCGFVNSQQRFTLWPLNVQLVNGEQVWLNAVLCVFENLMGVLKLELPLVNVSPQALKDYDYDAYIKSVDDKWDLLPADCELTIRNLRNAYIQRITNKSHLTIIAQEGMLRNVILARFDGMPKQIHNIPGEVQEELYKIIAAPVSEVGGVSHRHIAREYIEKQSWGYHSMKYILSTTGGCLSIVDTSLVDWLRDYYKEQWKVGILDKDNIITIDKGIIRDLCINAEFALLIPLLKHMNSAYIYSMKQIKPEEIHNVQMKYNLNLMFISKLQEFCYGSASEQVEVFGKLMPYYLKEKIVTEKMQSIDRLLTDEESQRYEKLNNFISIVGLIMASVFGLPAIYDTFKILRGLCVFITYNIPLLTIENTSFGVWILLIIVLIVKIFRSRKISRKNTMLF